MPKIKSLINGAISHVRGDIAKELVAMGVAELLSEDTADAVASGFFEKPAPFPPPGSFKVPEPKFYTAIINGPKGPKLLVFVCEILNRKDYFSGDPATISDRDFGRPVSSIPPEALATYAKQWHAHPELRDANATYIGIPGIKGEVSKSTNREFDGHSGGRVAKAFGRLACEPDQDGNL